MAERIPQSVAKLVVFRAYLASDGKTLATGKTIAITISKNGATSFSNPNAGATNATEMAFGFYKFTLDTTDTGTLGPVAFRGAQADILDVGDVFEVTNFSAMAERLLVYDWTGVTLTVPARCVLNALRFLRNKWSISGTTLTVTKEDDTTTAWTGTVTPDAAADPITGVDPA